MFNQCIANGWLNKDPFVNYKSKVKEVVREFLNDEEIERIINKKFAFERLALVRDIFVLAALRV